ncbi:MAG: 30S ribosome-binding factor RbfA [Planctomycetota bacterium]
MSHRIAQVESLLKRTVSTVLQRGLGDPRTQGTLISVTKVDVSPDLKHATVLVSVIPEQHQVRAIHALQDATMHIQHQTKKAVALRVVPHLLFRLDKGLKKQAETLAAINEAMQRTAETSPTESQPTADTPEAPDTPRPSET